MGTDPHPPCHLQFNGSFFLAAGYSAYYLLLEPLAGLSWAGEGQGWAWQAAQGAPLQQSRQGGLTADALGAWPPFSLGPLAAPVLPPRSTSMAQCLVLHD